MKNVLFLIMILNLANIYSLVAADNGCDIEVVLPEELMPTPKPLTADEKARADKERSYSDLLMQIDRKLPYHDDETFACKLNTLGLLVKLTDTIAVTKIVDVEDVKSKPVNERLFPKIKLTISAETNLLGHLDRDDLSSRQPAASVALAAGWRDLKRALEDEKIDEGVKDYVRLILLPSRQPQIKP